MEWDADTETETPPVIGEVVAFAFNNCVGSETKYSYEPFDTDWVPNTGEVVTPPDAETVIDAVCEPETVTVNRWDAVLKLPDAITVSVVGIDELIVICGGAVTH